MASFTCARACAFCRQFRTSAARTRSQQLARDLLDLVALLRRQLRSWPRQEVEDRQLLLGQVLADVPLLLLRQRPAQGEQFLEQLVDVPAAGVVGLDQLLELGQDSRRASG